jgi:hypothetical protein
MTEDCVEKPAGKRDVGALGAYLHYVSNGGTLMRCTQCNDSLGPLPLIVPGELREVHRRFPR